MGSRLLKPIMDLGYNLSVCNSTEIEIILIELGMKNFIYVGNDDFGQK